MNTYIYDRCAQMLIQLDQQQDCLHFINYQLKMGGNNSQTINPNSQNQPKNQQQNPKGNGGQNNEQMLNVIKDAFRNCATNGQLTKDKFNQALSILEALRFKRLRDTPLADRLFVIFDKGRTGQINQSQFITGISQIIGDREAAVTYTFRVYDRDGDNLISRKEFMLFIQESWKAAFRLLSQDVDSNSMGVRIKDIQSWTTSKISVLNQSSSQLFNSISNGKDTIDFINFKQFVQNGSTKDISAQLDQKCVVVPLNLVHLQI